MSQAAPQVRVGDRERRAVDDRLTAAVGDGALTLHEYDERSVALWQARTRGELDELVADLRAEPVAAGASTHDVPSDGCRPRRVVAVMSEDRLSGALSPGRDVRGYAVMGKAVVDLRRTDPPGRVQVQVRALMGEVEVLVPAGTDVHLSGFSLMGERMVEVGTGDGPSVHVDAVAVMGSVKVTHGDGTVVRAGGPTRMVPAPRPPSLVVPSHTGAVHRTGVRLSGTGGFVPFGATTCEEDCVTGEGPVVHVRSFGDFGTVAVMTQRQYAEEQARERAEEQEEDREDREDD